MKIWPIKKNLKKYTNSLLISMATINIYGFIFPLYSLSLLFSRKIVKRDKFKLDIILTLFVFVIIPFISSILYIIFVNGEISNSHLSGFAYVIITFLTIMTFKIDFDEIMIGFSIISIISGVVIIYLILLGDFKKEDIEVLNYGLSNFVAFFPFCCAIYYIIKNKGINSKTIFFTCIGILMLSRGALLAFIVTILLYTISHRNKVLFFLLMLSGFFIVDIVIEASRENNWGAFNYYLKTSSDSRVAIYTSALENIQENIFLGFGYNNYKQFNYLTLGEYKYAHNFILTRLIESGFLLGLISLLMELILVVRIALSNEKIRFILIFVYIFSLFEIIRDSLFLTPLIAILILSSKHSSVHGKSERARVNA